MSDANKRAMRRFMDEAFAKGNLTIIDELVADDFIDHNPPPNIPGNKDGLRQTVKLFRTAFPDLSVEVTDIIAEGDKVAVRLITRGTHKGEMFGIPATGRSVTINEQHWVRFKDGKAAEHWGVEDNLGMLQQLGVMQTT